MKKTLSLILIILLSFTLVSCRKKEFEFNDDSEINFMGNTFTIYSGTVFSDSWNLNDRKRGENASTDRLIDRIEEIEKNYNVKIYNESGNLQNKIFAMTMNGGGGCDMISCGNDILYDFYELGILTPFSEIGVRDHEDVKFGIPSLLVEGTFGGVQYGIEHYLGDTVPGLCGLITVNMNLIKELSMTDPHEYVESGEWDWNNFKVELKKGTFDDGDIRHIGMISVNNLSAIRMFFPAIISNGGYIIKETDGIYKTGIFESNAIEAMEYITGLSDAGLIQVKGGDEETWVEGKTWPFIMDGGYTGYNDIEQSIVRFPYGPSGNPDIVASYSINRDYYAFTMLSSFSNDEIGIIVDDLLEPLDTSLYPEGWKDYAKENLFYNDSDYETYITGLESMNYYPIGVFYGTNAWNHKGEVEDALDNILMEYGTAQAELDSVKDILNKLIDEKLNDR